ALQNWRLPRKMLVAFTLIAIVVASLGGTAIIANKKLGQIADDHVTHSLAGAAILSDIRGYIREYRILVYSVVTARSSAELAELNGRLAKNHTNIDEALAQYGKAAGEEFAEDVTKFTTIVDTLKGVNERIFGLSNQNQREAAMEVLKTDGKKASHAAINATNDLMTKALKLAEEKRAEGNAFSSNAFMLVSMLVMLSVGLLVVIWNLLNRTLARPLAELTSVTTTLAEGRQADVPYRDRADELGEIAKAVELFRLAAVARQEVDRKLAEEQKLVTSTLGDGLSALAQGDLTAEVKAEFPAGVASLKTNFNEAVERLREMIGAVSESAAGIRTGATEIAQASEDLARRTEGNAASLEETSAALVQIDDRLKATATAASRTVERADQAIATVGGGRSIADEAVQAMERVRESATGIDSVIEGLDKIAFQTRVLAMNAAVEAGRAGDAGRGFAVVADLVSSLAMRAEEEAKRARDQLTVTQTDIVTAVEAVQRVDGALADISNGVGEVHTLLGSMAADNQAQSSAVSQISVAISTMDQSTQQNAAMVEETSAAARNLTTEVSSLAEQAALFRTGDVPHAPAKKTAKPAAAKPMVAKTYISPVKPLAVAAMANGAGGDWSDF
ncbi:MAG: methyl-accepting chemotaxis protein, partial [Sphingomonadaceae bacterium]